MSSVWISAATRTPVGTRNGQLRELQAWQLASPLIRRLLDESCASGEAVDTVIMGNALYGGGNPARLAALDAGLPETVSALTIDSQCCGGIDAILVALQRIQSGAADIVIAGGLESWSRAPLRYRQNLNEPATPYHRPPFTPWPDKDPDMIEAAGSLARDLGITREKQQHFAIESHHKALVAEPAPGILPIAGVVRDEFSRALSMRLCNRLPALTMHPHYALNSATIAPQADGAALVLLMSDRALKRNNCQAEVRVLSGLTLGADPTQPALAPIGAAQKLLRSQSCLAQDLHSVHLMEAFAVQALAFLDALDLDPLVCNPLGGALARGHPIGASGAIEVSQAFHTLKTTTGTKRSLCAIAAAGGLGSALLLERE